MRISFGKCRPAQRASAPDFFYLRPEANIGMETLHPELWKEIFTDSLYIIPEKGMPVVADEKKMGTEPLAVVPAEVKPVAPVAEPVKEKTVSLPESPRLPVQPKTDVQPKTAEVMASPALPKPEGKYINGVLILLHESQKMTPSQQEMLTKIVKAVQLDLTDCGILSVASPADLGALQALNPRFLLSFGIARESFKPEFSKEYYSIQKHANTMVLLADGLGNLEKTDTLKRNLWNALKELFSLK